MLLRELHVRVRVDAVASGLTDDQDRLRDGGTGATAYADALVTYMAFAIDRCVDYWSSLATWAQQGFIGHTFGRQAIPMTWDFAEVNPFSTSTGSWVGMVAWVKRAVEHLPAGEAGVVVQRDARASVEGAHGYVVSTDPPYYDAVPYADISDYFYVWLRPNLKDIWPDECATLLTPKSQELVADSQRYGSPHAAAKHFEFGMSEVMRGIAKASSEEAPATIYYAYKSRETGGSTGWSIFLESVLSSGLEITATWPIRTEKPGRMRANNSNALASSVVLVCRRRSLLAALSSRSEFMSALRAELPNAIALLQSGNIAPVDLAQATIGPGIRVFSRYARVVEADGSPMSVAVALGVINDVLGEVLDGEEAELDADTRFASTWYAQNGYSPGRFGDADGQARAKNTSLEGIQAAGIGEARGGKFRLYERSELSQEWSPLTDERLTVWEATQHLVSALERSESETAQLLQQLGGYGDRARQLAYVLFQKATDKGWTEEAGVYNSLILAWPALQAIGTGGRDQQRLL
jgi:putative DNA methylase